MIPKVSFRKSDIHYMQHLDCQNQYFQVVLIKNLLATLYQKNQES